MNAQKSPHEEDGIVVAAAPVAKGFCGARPFATLKCIPFDIKTTGNPSLLVEVLVFVDTTTNNINEAKRDLRGRSTVA
ncbi:MAG: hypothetical protein KJS66_02670 [Acidobacteria bacterium]|nr:hypothetical protein [Acidobacteriota bacterium]